MGVGLRGQKKFVIYPQREGMRAKNRRKRIRYGGDGGGDPVRVGRGGLWGGWKGQCPERDSRVYACVYVCA